MTAPDEFARLRAGIGESRSNHSEFAGAMATITRTRGSTFRRPGSSMLIRADGSVECALSGGCPQRDIVTRAQQAMALDRPEIARYNRDTGLDVLMEMGCGGELEVLIEPLLKPEDALFLDAIVAVQAERACGFMATVFGANGHALAPRPQRLVWNGRTRWNDVRDGALADQIMPAGIELTDSSAHPAAAYALATPNGQTEVLIQRLQPRNALTIIGFNAAALALARTSLLLGWETMIVDQREPETGFETLPPGARFVRATASSLVGQIKFDKHSSVVVMTFNLAHDKAFLDSLKNVRLAYLGAIGSRERIANIRESMQDASKHLHAPAGLDIGSETPQEIAISICAEILAVINARHGASLASVDSAIHA